MNQIRPLDRADKKALEAFIRFPFEIYQRDPHWVPHLLVERRQLLSAKNPYFSHAKVQLWMAYSKSGQAIGRISAQLDQLGPRMPGERVGSFGLFECINDRNVALALVNVAQSWLKENGCTLMTGPFSLSINQESGLLVDGFDSPPYIMMGHAPKYYADLLQYAGLQKAKDLYAWKIQSNFVHTQAIQALQKKYASRIRIRAIDKKHIDRESELFRQIFNRAWQSNWGFIPFTPNEFKALSKELLQLVSHDLFRLAELDGEPAGMIVMLPNFNQSFADLEGKLLPSGIFKLLYRLLFARPTSGRVALMGVEPQIQNTMAGSAVAFLLITSLQEVVVPMGIRDVEMSWVLEDNSRLNKMLSSIGGERYKTYRVYQKALRP